MSHLKIIERDWPHNLYVKYTGELKIKYDSGLGFIVTRARTNN